MGKFFRYLFHPSRADPRENLRLLLILTELLDNNKLQLFRLTTMGCDEGEKKGTFPPTYSPTALYLPYKVDLPRELSVFIVII